MPDTQPPTLPTRERLIALAEASERRPLTLSESRDLRIGITHLSSQLGGAGGRIRKLTADLEQAQKKAGDAQRRLDALNGLTVPCGYCEQPAGQPCRAQGGEVMAGSHTARVTAAERASWMRDGAA